MINLLNLKCLVDWFRNDMWYMHTLGSYSALKKNGMLPLVTTWMDLEGVMLREMSK